MKNEDSGGIRACCFTELRKDATSHVNVRKKASIHEAKLLHGCFSAFGGA
ncbi:hypothetical protein [uncultured Selenomonas sp.]|nr:hypothetical protein [uncultured Selenomonas sp.]